MGVRGGEGGRGRSGGKNYSTLRKNYLKFFFILREKCWIKFKISTIFYTSLCFVKNATGVVL